MNHTYHMTEGYIHLPVHPDAAKRYVRVLLDSEQLAEFHIGLSNAPAFYCAMALTKYIGREVTLETDGKLPEGICVGGPIAKDNPLYPDLYQETFRPSYHFSSRRGWLNDPNGLYYDGSLYHLYYQHNPYGILHGGVNIHWGHATSPDAVRWTEHDDAIAPINRAYHIASGSAIVDRDGIAGFGKGAAIAAYTALGSVQYDQEPPKEGPSFGQYFAYSTDGGMSFQPFPDNPRIPTEHHLWWRDPRLFQLDDEFITAVYETDAGENCVSFYHSRDLRTWTRTARAEKLYECPDLFTLTCVETGERLWALYGADGMYRIGTFEGGAFRQAQAPMPMDYGDSTYAGQTWTGRDDADGRLHISWIRGMGENTDWSGNMGYPGMPFSQCMSAPCLLTLHKADVGYRLHRTPYPALDSLRDSTPERGKLTANGVADLPLGKAEDLPLMIESDGPVRLRVGRMDVTYDPATGGATFGSEKRVQLSVGGVLRARLLVDRTTVELFLMDEITATYAMDNDGLSLRIESARADVTYERYRMCSIW